MDSQLAALFYVGIIVPTFITISVFLGFLVCLYKRNLHKRMSRRALPALPLILPKVNVNNRSFDKFDKCSQHSADSAIDMGDTETSLDEKLASTGLVLDARGLEKSTHSYQNEGMQLMTEAEIHRGGGGLLRKGYYPSREKLNEEIHSQVKIYEKMSDVQRVALNIQQKNLLPLKESERRLVEAAAHKQFSKLQNTDKAASRYTSTSKLVPGACVTNTPTSKLVPGACVTNTPTSKLVTGDCVTNTPTSKLVTGDCATNTPPSTLLLGASATNNNQLDTASNYASYPSPRSSWHTTDSSTTDRYSTGQQLTSAVSWKPNISVSCSSNTDNYSSVESSQV